MSDDRIAEIRARHEDNASIGSIIHGPDHPPRWTLVGWKAHHDRAFLLLELDRVSAENERLRASLKQFRCSCDPGECVEYGERWASVCEKGEARDALEGKP